MGDNHDGQQIGEGYVYAPVRNLEGVIGGVMAVCNEVTLQVRARRESRRSRQRHGRTSSITAPSSRLPASLSGKRIWDGGKTQYIFPLSFSSIAKFFTIEGNQSKLSTATLDSNRR